MSKEIVKVNSLKQFIDVNGLNLEDEILRKRLSTKITISADEEKTCTAVISSSDEDADNDMVMPLGADLKRFEKNAVVLYAHNYSGKPVAKVVALTISEDALTAKMKFADTAEANDVWSLIKGGFLSACSIGFIVKERYHKGTEEFNKFVKDNKIKVKDTVQRIISKFELIENSIVPVPSNPEALIQAISAKSISLSDKTIKDLDLPKVIIIKTEPVIEAKIEQVEPKVEEKVIEVPKVEEVKPVEPERYLKVIKSVEPKYLKVIRNGGVDINGLVEKQKLAKLGKVI